MTRFRTRTALSVFGLATALAACAPDRVVTGSAYPVDYRERHPIVLTHAPQSLDLFLSGSRLDRRQREDLAAFVAEYRRSGEGPMSAAVPEGPGPGAAAVRATLAEAGVPFVTSTYPVRDPALAAPIRLSFRRLQAKVASRCGLWPQDLGVSDARFDAQNSPYWNLGCAMQTNIAAQVADPVDLVRGRAESRVDTIRRMGNVEKLRKGEDPSTNYRKDEATISDAVGNE
jgi:pilus assembly protein CpaD